MVGADREPPAHAPLVVGVGNAFRRDDGVGPRVVQRLRELDARGELRLVEASGEGASLMATWRGERSVVIVDAARSHAAAGTVHRFDAAEVRLPSDFFHYSSHAFGVAEAIELARALGELPERLVVWAVEGGSFGAGRDLTPPVESAVDDVARRILAELPADLLPPGEA
ncbi:MAG: hydrogenase maturation protease [Planctomycetes bacterium]|nr:hydrogenase maturation protease [Planctomycetota bacterium]